MWSFFVVFFKPLFGLLPPFPQALKHKHIEHRFTVAAIESFNEAVLHRFAGLDELERHAMIFGPVSQRDGDQLWSIVQPELERIAALSGYPLQRSHDARCRQVEIYFDRQALAIEIIHHVEGAKATITPQRITHEVCGPTLVHCFRRHQWSGTSCRHTFFAFPSFVQFSRAINEINTLVIPAVTHATQTFEQLAKSLFWSLPGQFQQQFNYWTIAVWSRFVVIDRAW